MSRCNVRVDGGLRREPDALRPAPEGAPKDRRPQPG